MRKMWKNLCLTAVMLLVFAMPVSASTHVSSPEFPGDDYTKEEEDHKADDDYMKDGETHTADDDYMRDSRSPKTGDESPAIYGLAMTAIALAGTVLIAKKKEI